MPLTFSNQSSSGVKIDSLDGLRGVAVIFVLLSHLSNANLHLLPFISFSGIGKVGVWLFFLLSAFLLSLQLFDKSNEELIRINTWRTYFRRRFFRIYPLFLFVMIVSYITKDSGIFPPLAAPSDIYDLANRIFLIDAKGIEWSILVEFRFYFLLPVVVLLVILWARRDALITSTALALSIAITSLFAPPPSLVEMLPYLSIFLIGSFAAYLHWRFRGCHFILNNNFRIIFESLAGLSFFTIALLTPSVLSVILSRNIPLDYFHETLTPFAILWAIFLLGQLWGAMVITKVLCARPLKFLGTISFSLYLLHPPIIKIVADNTTFHPTIQAILVLVFVITSSVATYYLIERPFLNNSWKIKLHGNLKSVNR